MNVDHRWLGTSGVRVRVVAAALGLLAAGGMVLGWGSRSRQVVADAAAGRSSLSQEQAAQARSSQARSLLAGLPLRFEPNQGQASLDPADRRARFVARGSGYSLLLGSEGAILNLTSRSPRLSHLLKAAPSKPDAPPVTRIESLGMKLAGANPNARLTAGDLLPGKSNYFLGNDPAKWRRNVPQFARVRYEGIYPGINLVFYGNQGHLEYDFQVAAGSDPARAELEFDGAKSVELRDGALVIVTAGEAGSVRLEAPRVYQEIAGVQQPVAGRFVLRGGNRVGFSIGAYDRSRQLVIDPLVDFSTYFGGTGDERNTSVAVDGSGNIYLAGSTNSQGLATPGVHQTTLNSTPPSTNVYIAKITPPSGASPSLAYVTYLGGSGNDTPAGIAVDAGGDAFVAGTTSSNDFPTTATAYQSKSETGTGTHVFVTELNGGPTPPPASQLNYSSYLSGNGTDIASGMTVDAHGNIFVTGTTTSVETSTSDQFPASNLPIALPYQSIPKSSPGDAQFFVTKVDTNNVGNGSIAYSTYFGGGTFVAPLVATGGGIAVDNNGNIYFDGTTNYSFTGNNPLTDFPILNAYQPCLNQVPPTVVINPPTCATSSFTVESDAFVAKLNPNAAQGLQLLWSTYFGGLQNDSGTGIAIDTGAANVYITGTTNSQPLANATTSAAFQPCLNNLYTLTGTTESCTAQTGTTVPSDAFVARLTNPATGATAANVSLTYFSYLGGSQNEAGLAIAVDTANGALLTGWTQSPSTGGTSGGFPVFPLNSNIQTQLTGGQDAFVARLNTAAPSGVGQTNTASWATFFAGAPSDASTVLTEGTSIALDSSENTYVAGDTNSPDLFTKIPLPISEHGAYNGGSDAFVAEIGSAASLSISGVLTGANQAYISAGNQATFTYTLTNNGPDLAENITLTDNISPATTNVPVSFISAGATSGTCAGGGTSTNVVCNIPTLQSGSTVTITIVLTPTPITGGAAPFNGGAVLVTGANNITPATTTVFAKMSDYSIQVGPSSVAVPAAGDTATYQVLLTPNPVYSPPGGISLTCSGLPTGSTCAFSTTPVTLSGTSPGSVTLNITTTARPIVLPTASLWGGHSCPPALRHFYAIWLTVPGLALLGIGVGGNRRRRRVAGMLMLCVLFALLLLQPACSKTSTTPPVSGTPPGTYGIIVAATAGSDTKSANISLVVP